MNIKKIAWLTDIHLNFLNSQDRKKFYNSIDQAECDAILITGDIAEAPSICNILNEFSEQTNKKIYFVLGNHDYYSGSVAGVRESIATLCSENKKLIWLGKPELIKLNNHTVLLGHDGWADARYGNFDHSTVTLNDSRLIAELFQTFLLNKSSLKNEMQRLADADAETLNQTLMRAISPSVKKIIIATHVPPFPECCLYKGKQSEENWLPYFASQATGDVISAFAQKNPEIDMLVLCGHTHGDALFKPFANLEIKAGGAQYYSPELQEIIHL
jgi:predicted MPP superfamily phosphohydrolase